MKKFTRINQSSHSALQCFTHSLIPSVGRSVGRSGFFPLGKEGIYLGIYLPIHLPTYPPIYPSIYLPIHLPTYLPFYLSISASLIPPNPPNSPPRPPAIVLLKERTWMDIQDQTPASKSPSQPASRSASWLWARTVYLCTSVRPSVRPSVCSSLGGLFTPYLSVPCRYLTYARSRGYHIMREGRGRGRLVYSKSRLASALGWVGLGWFG